MAFKLKRTVTIGLGGTGLKAVLQMKKKLIETYGEIPPLMKFLVIDTADKESLKTREGKDIELEPEEFLKLEVQNPNAAIKTSKEIQAWIPDNVPNFSITYGAKQVRPLGRLAVFVNVSILEAKIDSIMDSMRDFSIGRISDKYEIISDSILVNIVFSISGGTGSGTYLDIVTLVRKNLYDADKLVGYILLPDIFVGKPATQRVEPNTYATLKEINYFMEGGEYTYNLGGKTRTLDSGLFNAVYLINKTNKNGIAYNNLDDLTEILGLGMFLQSGSTGKGVGDIIDNLEAYSIGKNWIGKPTSFSSFGISELVFNAKWFADLLTIKVALLVLQKTFFSIVTSNKDKKSYVENFTNIFFILIREFSQEIQKKINEKRENQPFILELKPETLTDDIPSVQADDFYKWLKEEKQIDLVELSNYRIEDFKEIILEYSSSQKEVKEITDKSLEDILKEMIPEARNNIIKKLDDMASPLWQYDQGWVTGDRKTENICFFGVDNPGTTILDPEFLKTQLGSIYEPSIVSSGDPLRIACFKVETALPAFMIKNMSSYRDKYLDKDKIHSYHIHRDWENLPDLFPKSNEDNRKWWSLGLADPFKLIVQSGIWFYLISIMYGKKTDDHKIKLGKGRLEAFNALVKNEKYIEELKDHIQKITHELGNEHVITILSEYGNSLLEKAKKLTGEDIRNLVELEIDDIENYINLILQ